MSGSVAILFPFPNICPSISISHADLIHLVPDASQSVSTSTNLGFSQMIPDETDSLAPLFSLLENVPSGASLHILMPFPLL